jgi:hypothetical protein
MINGQAERYSRGQGLARAECHLEAVILTHCVVAATVLGHFRSPALNSLEEMMWRKGLPHLGSLAGHLFGAPSRLDWEPRARERQRSGYAEI